MNDREDGVPQLARLLGLSVDDLRSAIRGPWAAGRRVPDQLGGHGTVFTGLSDPRAPERPLIVIQVINDDCQVTVGYAVGFPLVTGNVYWSPAEPKTVFSYDEEEVRECLADPGHPLAAYGTEDPHEAILACLREAVDRVTVAATLRGTNW